MKKENVLLKEVLEKDFGINDKLLRKMLNYLVNEGNTYKKSIEIIYRFEKSRKQTLNLSG